MIHPMALLKRPFIASEQTLVNAPQRNFHISMASRNPKNRYSNFEIGSKQ